MIISITVNGIIICVILFLWAQFMKIMAKKFNVAFVTNYLPLLILTLSAIIYAVVLRSPVDTIINALTTTAVCCYTYDLYKAIKEMIQSIFSKIRTRNKSEE